MPNCILAVAHQQPLQAKLDQFERQHNRLLAQLREVAEHFNCRLNIFRIFAES